MNVDSKQSCRTVGWGFLSVATIIEVMLLCALFNTFSQSWYKLSIVAGTVIVFNLATWFMAVEYKQTLENLKRKK
jgi:hypothetical protein